MSHYFRLEIVRLLGWFLRKVWRKIYQGIHVDEKGVEMVLYFYIFC
jgi:glycerol-3-phosphate O-acyltransferase